MLRPNIYPFITAGTGPQCVRSSRRHGDDDDTSGLLLPRFRQRFRDQIDLLFLILLTLVLL